jgi:hypothetical protein
MTAILFNVFGIPGSHVARGECSSQDPPDEGFYSGDHVLCLPDLHKNLFGIFADRRWDRETVLLHNLQTNFVCCLGGALAVRSQFPAQNIFFLDRKDGSTENAAGRSMKEQRFDKVFVPNFFSCNPKIFWGGWVTEARLLDYQIIVNMLPGRAPWSASD